MTFRPEHIPAHTTHARRGGVAHAFRYSVDYVLIDPAVTVGPALFSRNRFNLASVADRDHGGARGAGRGASWVRSVLAERGLPQGRIERLLLLTQPRFMGFVFNPVSFWLAFEGEALIAAVAEVNNTFGDRHSYVCAKPGFAPILPGDRTKAVKLFHVSPFQEIAGEYAFAFDISREAVSILIAFRNGDERLFATLAGPRRPLTSGRILAAALRRPAGSLRVLALIYWQALRLRLKRAPYRTRPLPPAEEVS